MRLEIAVDELKTARQGRYYPNLIYLKIIIILYRYATIIIKKKYTVNIY